ncbi:unnamed protein product [Vitrella brassicaformis CCMP3155]|uniref:RING-type domain-containing protein n=1 Tax=Vitrella brassicaformis (strain CCMP3155) TaxID=1169540 RepID=A0A0G4ES74_VITBC|nr:unnamed protein product [Vitrella brassicaformis CCMP3155]|eukprot:CEM01465.1 unnamed protein product [Vitrella brassicaformis CCMP3155]
MRRTHGSRGRGVVAGKGFVPPRGKHGHGTHNDGGPPPSSSTEGTDHSRNAIHTPLHQPRDQRTAHDDFWKRIRTKPPTNRTGHTTLRSTLQEMRTNNKSSAAASRQAPESPEVEVKRLTVPAARVESKYEPQTLMEQVSLLDQIGRLCRGDKRFAQHVEKAARRAANGGCGGDEAKGILALVQDKQRGDRNELLFIDLDGQVLGDKPGGDLSTFQSLSADGEGIDRPKEPPGSSSATLPSRHPETPPRRPRTPATPKKRPQKMRHGPHITGSPDGSRLRTSPGVGGSESRAPAPSLLTAGKSKTGEQVRYEVRRMADEMGWHNSCEVEGVEVAFASLVKPREDGETEGEEAAAKRGVSNECLGPVAKVPEDPAVLQLNGERYFLPITHKPTCLSSSRSDGRGHMAAAMKGPSAIEKEAQGVGAHGGVKELTWDTLHELLSRAKRERDILLKDRYELDRRSKQRIQQLEGEVEILRMTDTKRLVDNLSNCSRTPEEMTTIAKHLMQRRAVILQEELPLIEQMATKTIRLAQAAERANREDKCVVCSEEEKDTILLPCGHKCVCFACAASVVQQQATINRVCPVCKMYVARIDTVAAS